MKQSVDYKPPTKEVMNYMCHSKDHQYVEIDEMKKLLVGGVWLIGDEEINRAINLKAFL
jgi:uridine kinase